MGVNDGILLFYHLNKLDGVNGVNGVKVSKTWV